jgi:hypothetical protein
MALNRLLDDTLLYCSKIYPREKRYVDLAHKIAKYVRTIGGTQKVRML